MKKLAVCTIVLSSLLLACATRPPLSPLPAGASVGLSFSINTQTDGVIKISNEALGNNTATGGASGMVVGGLWGLACGPFFIICSPALALVGGLGGTVAGAAVGLTGALSDENAAQLRERLARIQVSRTQLAALTQNVSDRAQRHWSLNADRPAYVVTVELQPLQLTSTRDDRISCLTQVLVSVVASDAPKGAPPWQKWYEHASTYSSRSAWMDEASDLADTSLATASQQIAAEIVSDLTMH